MIQTPPAQPAALVKAVDALVYGVSKTTQKNRSLPLPQPNIPIPTRVGTGRAV